MHPILELNDATVVKDDRRVLDGLTLTIHEGEHTSERWQGYMNGAVETGQRAAREILEVA